MIILMVGIVYGRAGFKGHFNVFQNRYVGEQLLSILMAWIASSVGNGRARNDRLLEHQRIDFSPYAERQPRINPTSVVAIDGAILSEIADSEAR